MCLRGVCKSRPEHKCVTAAETHWAPTLLSTCEYVILPYSKFMFVRVGVCVCVCVCVQA